MKQEVIDGTVHNLPVVYEIPGSDLGILDLDFLQSNDLDVIESGIRDLNEVSEFVVLAKGIAITKAEREGLYRQAGFSTLREYRQEQFRRLNSPKGTISSWRRIGEGYLDNLQFIQAYRLPIRKNIVKFSILTDALRRYDRAEVSKKFVELSFREFSLWVNPASPVYELQDVDLVVDFESGRILLDGIQLMQISDEIPNEERHFVSSLLKDGYRARRGNCIAHVVAVYDDGEARAVDNFIRARREKK